MRAAVVFMLICWACGPSHDLRKAKRLIVRAKAHGAIVKSDTVFTDRTYIVPGKETFVTLPGKTLIRDTVIYQDKIRIHIQRDTVREQIRVECPPDTIKVQVPVIVQQDIQCPPPSHTWRTVALVLGGLLVLIITLIVLSIRR